MKGLFLVFSFFLISCLGELPTVPDFSLDLDNIDLETTPLDDSVKIYMDGVYEVLQGKDLFGDEIVGKWINDRWCLYSKHDVVYSENIGGSKADSTIIFEGYIKVVRSGSGTGLKLNILPSDGGSELLSYGIPNSILFTGKVTGGSDIELKRIRGLYKPNDTTKIFHVIAHRGGGRNSERLGISENSIEMIRHAQVLGATGVEIDVKKTRDGKLILFHDATFSPRTISGTYLLGKVENFDLAQIRLFGRLINGETIPTLEEALREIVENTNLSLVWIDVKDPSVIDAVITAQVQAIDLAEEKNRDVLILFGIPSDEILDFYLASNLKDLTPILIELDAETASAMNSCNVWEPRWTNGMPFGDISRLHAINKLVFTWTLDVNEFIEDFLDSEIDGILSNYPSLVAGKYLGQHEN
jgi:glycerophosphoryl diester phosphodiesterase